MRTMMHNGRTKKGKAYGLRHNDRNFDVSKAEHIDPDKAHLNQFQNCYGDPSMTFEEAELKFYEEAFGEQLRRTNEAYERNGHPERCKTMEDWKKAKRNAPEETVIQIGRKYDERGHAVDEFTDHEKLMECYQDYTRRLEAWNEEHGRPFTLLSSALHADEEGLPHVHARRVWHYETEDGTLKVGQEKALAAAGVELPEPDKAPGRRNNRKMTFDRMSRELWLDVLHEHGIEIEREPVPDGRHNRDKEEMIRDKYEAVEAQISVLEGQSQDLRGQVATARENAHRAAQEAERAQSRLEAIQEDLNHLETPEAVKAVEAKPTMMGGAVKLPKEDWELVKSWADRGAAAISYGDNMQHQNEQLREEVERLQEQASGKMQLLLQNAELQKQVRELQAENTRLRAWWERFKQQIIAKAWPLWEKFVTPARAKEPEVMNFEDSLAYWRKHDKYMYHDQLQAAAEIHSYENGIGGDVLMAELMRKAGDSERNIQRALKKRYPHSELIQQGRALTMMK